IERDGGGDGALQQLRSAHALSAGRKLGDTGLAIADIPLMPGVAVEERGGRVQEFQALRVLEVVVEPAERVAVLVAWWRNGEVEAVLRLQQDLRGADLQDVENLARSLAGKQQPAQRLEMIRLVLMQHDIEEGLRLGRA